MATFCGGIKLDSDTLEVVNGIITKKGSTPTVGSVISVCGQQWDSKVFGKVRKNGVEIVTIKTPSILMPITTAKTNCGIKVDSRYFDVATGSVEFAMQYFLKVNTTPADATILVKQGEVEIEPVNGVYPVEDSKTYTITVTKTGYVAYTDDVVISAKDVTLDVELVLLSDASDTFADNEWSTIINACQSGSVPAAWVVGNQKTMTINGASYTVTIIGKAHDTYTAGGTAPLTFQLQDCYGTTYPMNSSNTNSGGWTSCAMRSTHLPAILALMPAEVKEAIQEVNKLSSAGSQSATINTTADKLFLLSEIEIFGSIADSKSGEGSQYAHYSAGNSKVKNFGGSAIDWWERSPRGSDSAGFCRVNRYGNADGTNASTSFGVAFGFCF